MVEAMPSDGANQPPAIPEHGQSAVSVTLLVALQEDEDFIDVWIAIQHLDVVTARQNGNVGLGIFFPQTVEARGCADEISDVVTADNQNLEGPAFGWQINRHFKQGP
jgi:hypothetical protein